jgi:hypothetical protein
VIALVCSLLVSLVCLQLLGTLIQQVDLMIPRGAMLQEAPAVKAAHAAWQSDWRVGNLVAQVRIISQRDATEAELTQWSAAPETSLAAWADLLARLRNSGIEPARRTSTQPSNAATQPAVAEEIPRLLAELDYAPPLRIGLAKAHERFLAAAQERKMSVRRAEVVFGPERSGPTLAAYRPVLRELSGRLRSLGEHYERAGRPADAILAYRAAIRGLTDMVKDSPLPEVALLAVDELEPLVRSLQKLEPARGAGALEALEQFRTRWMELPDSQIGLLPVLFGPALTPLEHQAVLSSLTASGGLLLSGWLLAVLCLMLIIIVGLSRVRSGRIRPQTASTPSSPASALPMWRWGGWGAIVAPVAVVVPILCVVIFLASDAVPFIWLASARSLRAIILAPAITILVWMLATRLCLRPADPAQCRDLPRGLIFAGVALVVAAALVAAIVPMPGEPWRPPATVQFFRRAGALAGLASLLVSLTWAVWGAWSRRRAGLPLGLWARGGLAVASTAMLMTLLAAAVALTINHRCDVRHEAAFAKAATDPIGARLGPDWWNAHFAPARSLVEP